MSKPIPTIQKFMTPVPHSIGEDQTLAYALEVMRKHDIRHLPVLTDGVLVGVVTNRDLRMVESRKDVDPTTIRVGDAMSTSVYAVSPDEPLDEFVREMGAHKHGRAVVMENNKPVGVFTMLDVCNAFASLMETPLAK